MGVVNRHTYSTGHTYYGTQCRMKQEEGQGAGSAKEKVKAEDGKVDKPKSEIVWHVGVCKWFNGSKGWGFINNKDESENKDDDKNKPTGDIFVHQAVIVKEGFRSLGMGEEVEFQAVQSDKGWEAVRVRGVDGKEIVGMVREERRKKKVRCFNCGHVGHHL